MKTNRFDDAIRKKLEGIHPEFTEGDWNGFQKYYRANTPGLFRKVYGTKIGYAAVITVFSALTGICGLLYYQNITLKNELEEIKQLVSEQKNYGREPRQVATPAMREEVAGTINKMEQPLTGNSSPQEPPAGDIDEKTGVVQAYRPAEGQKSTQEPVSPVEQPRGVIADAYDDPEEGMSDEARIIDADISFLGRPEGTEKHERPAMGLSNGYDWRTIAVNLSLPGASRKDTETKKGRLLHVGNKMAKPQKSIKPQEEKRVLPTFVTSRPYRVGLAVSRSSTMTGYNIVNEFLISPRISMTWGLSRTVYDRLEYADEQIFAEKTKQNFRKVFGKSIPPVGEAINIETRSTLVQLPLFLAYRHPLAGGFTLTGGAGTHLNLQFRQTLEYGFWDGRKLSEISGLKYRKQRYPVINNFSPMLGVEKIFDPVVVQLEGFYHFQKNDIPYVSAPGGLRAQIKLMYQFGK